MKKALFFMLLIIFTFTACNNNNSVNILITNKSTTPIFNKQVSVSLDTVRLWLNVDKNDTLILLNEKNQPLPYKTTKDFSVMTFNVPVVHPQSQKNFSINKQATHLSQKLFAFRTRKIVIHLK